MLGVYAKYVDELLPDGHIRVKFYRSAFQVALFNFLEFTQTGENNLYLKLSESGKSEFMRLLAGFIGDLRFNGILGLSIHFAKNVSDNLLNEVSGLCKHLGSGVHEFSEKDFSALKDSDGLSIKSITSSADAFSSLGSYCSLAVPAAYLVRSERDAKGNLKKWPNDKDLDKILHRMSEHVYYSDNVITKKASEIAKEYEIEAELLSIMIQCMLVDQMLTIMNHDKTACVDFKTASFEKIVSALFKCILGG